MPRELGPALLSSDLEILLDLSRKYCELSSARSGVEEGKLFNPEHFQSRHRTM